MKVKTHVYVAAIMLCTVFFVSLIGIISTKTAKNILEENAQEKLSLISEKGTLNFNAAIDSIKQSVDTLSETAVLHMDDFEKFRNDSGYVDSYTESLEPIMLYTVKQTTGAMSVYIRYNPEIAYPTSGVFYVKNKKTGEFDYQQPTDLSLYSAEDKEYTGWYYDPVSKGEPVWMEPYENENIGYRMISYVVPLYIEGEILGVIGMDIDYDYICSLAQKIEAYENGYAFIVNKDGQVIYHPEQQLYYQYASDERLVGFNEIISQDRTVGQYTFSKEGKTVACSTLNTGMILCITAPNSEIYKDAAALSYQILIVSIVSLTLLALISTIIMRNVCKLSEIDELTGINNRRFFIGKYASIDSDKLRGCTLFVFDIDGFKQINDKYGHNRGDYALKFTAETAVGILGKSSIIARWGGDEFIGLVKNEKAAERLEKLRDTVEKHHSSEFGNITLSFGAVKTHGEKNLAVVTEIADTALYCSKSEGKNRITFTE